MKYIAIVLPIILIVAFLSGCGSSDKKLEEDAKKAEIASGSIILDKPVGPGKAARQRSPKNTPPTQAASGTNQ
jgi:hypothetical protein